MALELVDINVLSKTLIKVSFNDEVVIDDAYISPSSYTITSSEGTLEVTGVVPVVAESSLESILITREMPIGTRYTITVQNLRGRGELTSAISDTAQFESRVTKLDSILSSIPKHYDKRAVSILHAFLTAVSSSDDIIGGSKDGGSVII